MEAFLPVPAQKLFFCSFVDACYSVQASWVSDIRKTLGYDSDEEIPVVAKIHISFGVRGELGFASALSSQETEGDHFPLL